MNYLLHGSVYGLPLRAAPVMPAMERWQAVGLEATAVSIITEAQTLASLYLQGSERQFLFYQNTIRDRVKVIGIDEPVAKLYARLRARYQRSGKELNDPDLFVAATALIHGLTVATLGVETFSAADDVAWEDWSGGAAQPRGAGAPSALTRLTI